MSIAADAAATGPPPPRRRAAGGEDLFARRARLLEGDELALSGKVEEKQKVLDEEQKLERRIREQQVGPQPIKHFNPI